jgi:hypothetical protein
MPSVHFSSPFRIAVGLLIAACVAPAAGQVIITGGENVTTHEYWWTVINNSPSRIVRIEFPQWAADSFYTPDNWQQGTQKEMNLVNVGWSQKPGVCWAAPIPPYEGLDTGQSARFGMRISTVGALAGAGVVKVKFADGTETAVAGVTLPTQPPKASPLGAVLVLGLIFVVFIVYREYSRRKRPQPANDTDDAAPAGGED